MVGTTVIFSLAILVLFMGGFLAAQDKAPHTITIIALSAALAYLVLAVFSEDLIRSFYRSHLAIGTFLTMILMLICSLALIGKLPKWPAIVASGLVLSGGLFHTTAEFGVPLLFSALAISKLGFETRLA